MPAVQGSCPTILLRCSAAFCRRHVARLKPGDPLRQPSSSRQFLPVRRFTARAAGRWPDRTLNTRSCTFYRMGIPVRVGPACLDYELLASVCEGLVIQVVQLWVSSGGTGQLLPTSGSVAEPSFTRQELPTSGSASAALRFRSAYRRRRSANFLSTRSLSPEVSFCQALKRFTTSGSLHLGRFIGGGFKSE